MDAPILHYDFPLKPPDGGFGRWQASVDYIVWTGCFPAGAPGLTIWELVEGGAVRIPEQDNLMHVIRAGMPHHIEHLFGYWRVCDADIIYFRTVQHDDVYYMLVTGGQPGAYKSDALLWVCPKCATQMNRSEFETGKARWKRFWDVELDLVRAFNADEAQRTCPTCRFVHPPGYGFYPAEDDAVEADARARW